MDLGILRKVRLLELKLNAGQGQDGGIKYVNSFYINKQIVFLYYIHVKNKLKNA